MNRAANATTLSPPFHILIMGVSGSGKTTVGRALAQQLNLEFIEGDDFHPPQNREKMARGIPLTDADRTPWLDHLGQRLSHNRPLVLACSALRQAYRDHLRTATTLPIRIAWLDLPRDQLRQRLLHREAKGEHFMPAALLESQLETLEPPDLNEHVQRFNASLTVDQIVDDLQAWLNTDPTT